MTTACGLDFGTSNSTLSVAHNGEVKMVDADPCSPHGNYLKSVLYFYREDGVEHIHTGEKAIEEYLLNDAEGRYMQSIKTFLPDSSFTDTEIYRRSYGIDDLVAIVLKDLRKKGEASCGRDLTHVVMGRPVVFSEDPDRDRMAEERLKSAALKAGFKDVVFQLEPIAAALSYEKSLPAGQERVILVGDFGGGTSDFTVIKLTGGNRNDYDRGADILSLGGIYIGGNTFDSELMWEKAAAFFGKDVRVKDPMSGNSSGLSSTIMSKLRMWHWIPRLRDPKLVRSVKEFKNLASFREKKLIRNLESLVENNLGLSLYRSVEGAKCGLSGSDASRISFSEYGIDIDKPVTRDEFESIIAESVSQIDGCVVDTLEKAGLAPEAVDQVFLTGGSSHIPLLKQVFESRFGGDKIRHADAFMSVGYGLGLSASYLF